MPKPNHEKMIKGLKNVLGAGVEIVFSEEDCSITCRGAGVGYVVRKGLGGLFEEVTLSILQEPEGFSGFKVTFKNDAALRRCEEKIFKAIQGSPQGCHKTEPGEKEVVSSNRFGKPG